MCVFAWILSSVVVAVSLLLLSVFDGSKEELQDTIVYPEGTLTSTLSEALAKPQERLEHLNQKLSSKTSRLQKSRDKMEETKHTISKLEITSEQVQLKYNELIKQLKVELAKTESECQGLYSKIEEITVKRDKLKTELQEKQKQLPVCLSTNSPQVKL